MTRIILNENGSLVKLQLKNITRIEINDDCKKTIFYEEDKIIASIDNDTIEDVWLITEENINDI